MLGNDEPVDLVLTAIAAAGLILGSDPVRPPRMAPEADIDPSRPVATVRRKARRTSAASHSEHEIVIAKSRSPAPHLLYAYGAESPQKSAAGSDISPGHSVSVILT